MSSSTTSVQILEHVVLFNVKAGTDPSLATAMVNALSTLRSLDGVLYLTVGPVHSVQSQPPPSFTHMLHSRHRSMEDLAAYYQNPTHLGIVKETVFPICDDIMAIDWIAQPELCESAVAVPVGAAVRLQALKLKDGSESGEVIGKIGGELMEKRVSYGENLKLSGEMGKGFSVCLVGVFDELTELEKSDDLLEVKDYVEASLVVDYVVPAHA